MANPRPRTVGLPVTARAINPVTSATNPVAKGMQISSPQTRLVTASPLNRLWGGNEYPGGPNGGVPGGKLGGGYPGPCGGGGYCDMWLAPRFGTSIS
jgi:hypothetical protein